MVVTGPWPGITVSKSSLQRAVQRLGPFDQAAAARIIDQRRVAGHQVAGVEGPQRREINHRVAVGVAAAEVIRANFLAAQENRRFRQ